MRVFLILALLLATAFAGRDDDNMGFDEESSGDGRDSTVFPTDDEDIDTESSGEGTDANVAVDETETIDVENEPEVVNVNGRDKSVKTIDEEEPDSDLDDTDAEKPVEPDVEVDDDREVTNEEEDEGGDRDAGKYTGIETQFMAAVIVGGCIGLLFAICVIMLLVYRMRKKDEGSYSLEYDGKKPQGNYEYTKGVDSKEYYA